MGRWKDILNIMILKEPGNTKIHRLRVIHLFEADYNLILSVKWRQQIKHAEERELLNEGQYGSRSGRKAPTLPFLEELKNEISYCSRKHLLNHILPLDISAINICAPTMLLLIRMTR
jgi:hypothetical protein